MGYYVGMDIGGTFARVRVVLEDGSLMGERKTRGCTFNTSGYALSREIYQEAVDAVLQEWNLRPADCLGFCAAVSGVDTKEQARECKEIFCEMGFGEAVVSIYNDCEIILQLCEEAAVVLVAGTGSIAFGRTKAGDTVRCGGWGHILSDEGSGMDLGKRILRAVGDHMDGRRQCPILYQLFEEQCSVRSVDELDNYLNAHIMDKPMIANFAGLAETACEQGEPVAEEILRSAAQVLFELIRDTRRKIRILGETPKKLFLWGGVVTKNQVIAEQIRELVRENYPEMEILNPEMEVTEMAVLRARKNV